MEEGVSRAFFTLPVLDVSEVPVLWVVQQVITASFAGVSGVIL